MGKPESGADGPPSPRTRIRREPHRAVYDRKTIEAILDAGLICYVGYEFDGQPYVTPTSYWRRDDRLYWHGSSASRMLRRLQDGVPVCVTVTHVDGLVLARSGFNHAVNYRSVMALGTANVLPDSEKVPALREFTERLFPGRWDEVRPPTPQELKATTIMTMRLDEVSAKVRSGPPVMDDVDADIAAWSGVIPLGVVAMPPVADASSQHTPAPHYTTTINDRFAISLAADTSG